MKAFELYFEQKNKEDVFLQSFVCEPENVYQQRLGRLYMVGELKQALPQNAHFLGSLAQVLKKEYYSQSLKKSPEASLKEALKKGNEFLQKESKNGNVGWLGNLNFVVLSFKEPVLNFAKAGDLKIFLIRESENMDLTQSLEAELKSNDPLRLFGAMAGGKLSSDDRIAVVSKRIVSLFKKNSFIDQLSKVEGEKELKQLIKRNQEILAEASGACLVLIPDQNKGAEQTVTLRQQTPCFSLRKTFIRPIASLLCKVKLIKIKLPSLKTLSFKKVRVKRPALPRFQLPQPPRISFAFLKTARKQVFLLLSLVCVLLVFNFIFQGEKEKELKEAELLLSQAQTKVLLAESLAVLEENDKAKALFEEALKTISPLTKGKHPFKKEALSLKKSVENELKRLISAQP